MTERLVFKSLFPQVDLQICLHHTLRTFSREVAMEKLQISSTERMMSLKCLEKLAYSSSAEGYQKYTSFTKNVPIQVQNYFSSNWHRIRTEWAKVLKSFHLKNDTKTRVKSFFFKLKSLFFSKIIPRTDIDRLEELC